MFYSQVYSQTLFFIFYSQVYSPTLVRHLERSYPTLLSSLDFTVRRSLILFAASRCNVDVTWLYVSMVTEIFECPNTSITTRG